MPEVDVHPKPSRNPNTWIKLSELLSALVKARAIPAEVEEEIRATCKETRGDIRATLRDKCGLQLRKRDASPNKSSPITIRVEIQPGCPRAYEDVKVKESDKYIVELLAAHRNDLQKIADGGPGMINLYEKFTSLQWTKLISDLPAPNSSDINPSSINAITAWATALLARLDETAERITREILWVEKNYLGAYFCRQPARIELYWAVIGLIAKLNGWKIRDLAAKVLTHEWAHAYTQLGVDIDGDDWAVGNFEKAERSVKEGLAQYYTHQTLKFLQERNDWLYGGAFRVYRKLSPLQPSEYRVHHVWLGDKSETVRRAMLELRWHNETTLGDFNRRLSNARRSRTKPEPDTAQLHRPVRHAT